MADKKYYTIDRQKKRITLDESITPTEAERSTVSIFVASGYEVRVKSQKRAAAMKKKLSKDDILEALAKDSKGKATFEDIISGKATNKEGKTGFFAARKWYEKEYKPAESK